MASRRAASRRWARTAYGSSGRRAPGGERLAVESRTTGGVALIDREGRVAARWTQAGEETDLKVVWAPDGASDVGGDSDDQR